MAKIIKIGTLYTTAYENAEIPATPHALHPKQPTALYIVPVMNKTKQVAPYAVVTNLTTLLMPWNGKATRAEQALSENRTMILLAVIWKNLALSFIIPTILPAAVVFI